MAGLEGSVDPREAIAVALGDALSPEQLRFLIEEVLAVKKRPWVHCPSCKRKSQVEVVDTAAVVRGLTDLLREGFGRRGEEAGDSGERIVFVREVR